METFVLWICIAAAGGTCTVEKRWPTRGWVDCTAQLKALRIEPVAPQTITVTGQATSIEATGPSTPGPRVVAGCVRPG